LHPQCISLPIALRVFPKPERVEARARSTRKWKRPEALFVFDTETRVDATQRLTFGSYRLVLDGRCVEENLFCGDDLPKSERRILTRYAATQASASDDGRKLRCLSRHEFVEKLFRYGYRARALIVGFNLPFDLSRIACDATSARGRFRGGFSLRLWSYLDETGRERSNQFRPRIGIKQIDSKRALKGFTARNRPDAVDLIPEGSETGEVERGYIFRGHFLDLRTLAFALTDRGYSLETACEAFAVDHGKQRVESHGSITKAYIDYNRRDVLATEELADKLLREYEKHPIALQETKTYSPASIGKAYLRAMGISPILERQLDFPRQYLGYAQSAFFGGRTGAHIRKASVPNVYTDFLSMYPTVNSHMNLWLFVTARKIDVVEHCQVQIESFLRELTLSDLFKSATWKHLTGFVKIIPDGDILPSRAKYSAETNDWQVAVNYLYWSEALWFSLPDVVASVILTGRIPKIVDAFRIVPRGKVSGLKTIKLRGAVDIDPRKQDFFKVVIEQRKLLSSRTGLSKTERERLDKALKVLANATSYGIYAEMIRQEVEEKVNVRCYGIDEHPFTCRITHPDVPGEYCFPPLASLITGAARLMLALLEHCVSELGGTYAMEDTDSMAIVATEQGGLVPCKGGPHRTNDGREAVKALSWKEVQKISDRFAALNPYNRTAVPGSILKIEDDNFDLISHQQRQIYCFAISAKRYALFLKDERGVPALLQEGINNKQDRWSEHGLGHLLNPSDLQREDRDWIGQTWLNMVHRAMGLATETLPFQYLPAVGRVTVSSPAVTRPLSNLNSGKTYGDQIKPFNFLLTCQVQQLGHPVDADPERFHLITQYELDPKKWLKRDWIDQYSGKLYRITTSGQHGSRRSARVKTYGEVLLEYEFHPESKCADSDGNPCGKQTIGLLQRRYVRVDQVKYIGKESNSLEEVEAGLIHSADAAYTEYTDSRRDEWQTKILAALKKAPLSVLEEKSSFSRRMLMKARAGTTRPHRKNRERLAALLKELNLLDCR
jgi:hypothetical protein